MDCEKGLNMSIVQELKRLSHHAHLPYSKLCNCVSNTIIAKQTDGTDKEKMFLLVLTTHLHPKTLTSCENDWLEKHSKWKTKPLDDRSQRGSVVGDIEPLRPIHYMKQIKMF